MHIAPKLLGLALAAWCGVGSSSAARTVIYRTSFPGYALPEGWVERGGWSVDTGLRTPAVGGFDTWAIWQRQTTLDQVVFEARFRLLEPNSKFGLVRRDLWSNRHGTIGLVDAQAQELRFYGAWDGTSAPPVSVSARIPLPLVLGREYRVALWKTDLAHQGLTLLDLADQRFVELAAIAPRDLRPGNQWDAPGFLFLAGAVHITAMEYAAPYARRPRLLLLGDSLVDGYALVPNYEAGFARLIQAALGGDCVIAGRAGETSASVLERLPQDAEPFTAAFALILLGTNDLLYEEWLRNLRLILGRLEPRGVTPLLGTLPPWVWRQALIDLINAWIRASGYRYIDFAKRLTVNGDSTTQIPGYFLSDLFHPSPAGNVAMFDAVQTAVPDVFGPVGPRTLGEVEVELAVPLRLATPGFFYPSWPGLRCELEYSADLRSWARIGPVTSPSVYTLVLDPSPAWLWPQRFYRLRLP